MDVRNQRGTRLQEAWQRTGNQRQPVPVRIGKIMIQDQHMEGDETERGSASLRTQLSFSSSSISSGQFSKRGEQRSHFVFRICGKTWKGAGIATSASGQWSSTLARNRFSLHSSVKEGARRATRPVAKQIILFLRLITFPAQPSSSS